ncbi:MAG: DUF2336 domain-containing protein [Azospirillaceae bacterium]|nr:DUF2336 domain-containing protein [Azospirillaceae bacterium]
MEPSVGPTHREARHQALHPDPAVRESLAARPDIAPEFLFLLASDPSAAVRRTVAANAATPAKARRLLAADRDPDVRVILAQRLATVLSGSGTTMKLAVDLLDQLARDEASSVRQAVASALKDVACAPHSICVHLAQDIAQAVGEPILRYWIGLTDDDLLAIIADSPADWRLEAIAQRDQVGSSVVDAVYHAHHDPATKALIENPGAVLSPDTLRDMADDSARKGAWQEPLARRAHLPPAVALRLAEVVDEQVLTLLSRRRDFDAETVQEIRSVVRRRLDFNIHQDQGEGPQQHAVRLYNAGMLDERTISDALAWADVTFVKVALVLLSQLPLDTVNSILGSGSAKAVTALAWKAGLSMRCALQLQLRVAKIEPKNVLNARMGVDYPLPAADLNRSLALFSEMD